MRGLTMTSLRNVRSSSVRDTSGIARRNHGFRSERGVCANTAELRGVEPSRGVVRLLRNPLVKGESFESFTKFAP
jgi:hypothetical protein